MSVSAELDLSRFSPITANDHAGYVWIVTILGITYTLSAAILRAWIKRGVYGWDDALGAMGTTIHLAQSISIFIGLADGMAKSDTVSAPQDWPQAGKVSTLPYTCTPAAILMSTGFFHF